MKNAWRSSGAGAALILLLTVVAYWPSLRGGFVYDDRVLITENRMVQASDGLYRFWFTSESRDYRPLAWSLWWLEWRLWDGRPMGYHVVNVFLHAVNAVLVWVILRQLKIPGAWLAAMVFAIHPVNVATVAWISEQKNTLSMLFYALAILLYLRFDEEGVSARPAVAPYRDVGRDAVHRVRDMATQERSPTTAQPYQRLSKERWTWYGLSLAAFFLGLLSKTAIVMLPVVLLGCVWWRHGRVRGRDWLYSVPYFAAALVLSLVTIVQHQRALPESFARPEGFTARLPMAGWVPWFYLYKALVPIDLTVIYPKWGDPTRWISYVPGLIWLGVFVILWQKRATWGRPLLFGLGYFLVMLFPVLGFFDQGFYYCTLVADHWQYYSIIGVIALAVAAAQRVGDRIGEQRRYWGMAAGVAVLVVLGVATWKRGGVYTDEETLWRDNVAKNPIAWAAHNNLGFALHIIGKLGDAIGHYEQALRLKPDYAEAQYNLGVALARLGRDNEAIGHYEQALRLQPDLAEAQYNLGVVLARLGRVSEAIGHWEQALRLKPGYAEAHNNLGNALARVGKVQEAIRHYEQALRLNPDNAETRNNLAWLLATLVPAEGGDPLRAVALAQRSCEITGNRAAAYLDTLAVAYAAAGRFDEAIATAQKAIGLANSDGRPELAKEIDARLELYRSGRAYRVSAGATSPVNP